LAKALAGRGFQWCWAAYTLFFTHGSQLCWGALNARDSNLAASFVDCPEPSALNKKAVLVPISPACGSGTKPVDACCWNWLPTWRRFVRADNMSVTWRRAMHRQSTPATAVA